MSLTPAASEREWERSPCSDCPSSPCCTRLPLRRFRIETRADFDMAMRAIRHPRIEIGLYDSGWWMAYYLAPCRHLDPLSSKCLVHRTEAQPEICKRYGAVRCWYKRVFVAGVAPDFLRFNQPRLAALESMISFDENGELGGAPPWEQMQQRLAAIPLGSSPAAAAAAPVGEPAPRTQVSPPIEQIAAAPDSGDAAGLLFPFAQPRTRGDLDLIRFRLGFHGVRIAVSHGAWATVIGDPPEARGFHLVGHDGTDVFLASFTFDEKGRITSMPELPASAVQA